MAVPDASASRHPRAPQTQVRPSGSTHTWPMWPALPDAPSSRRPSSTIPPPTPVETTMAMKSSTPAAAPFHPSARAKALASLSTKVSRPVASASRDRNGKSRQAGMFSGETASPPAVIGPPQPTPHTAAPPAPTVSTRASSAENKASPSSAPDGAVADATTSPSAVTSPAASLVPPMSTARAQSLLIGMGGEGIPPPAAGTVVALHDVDTTGGGPHRPVVLRSLRRHRGQRGSRRAGQGRRHPAGPVVPGGRGPPADRGRPGCGQDQPGQGGGRQPRLLLGPHPVHPRPSALRRDRRQHLQPGHRRL